jgi:hypothetical protein
MTDKVQKIREEVIRLKSRICNNSFLSDYEKGCNDGREDICDNLISFIDSLQEEPATKDFEAALAEEWKGYNDRGAEEVDALEDNTQELAFAKGFYRGWHHPKSSVWHDAREEPEEGKDFAFVTYNGIMWARYRIEDIFLGWQRYRVQTELDKWAYVSDLLKL